MLVTFESFSHGVASYAAIADLVVETLENDSFRFRIAPTFHLPFPFYAMPSSPVTPEPECTTFGYSSSKSVAKMLRMLLPFNSANNF